MEPYTLIQSHPVYKGKIIDVVQDTITLPDGRQAIREVVVHIGAAAILPVLPDGRILLVRQYRHPAKKMVLEIPAGTLEKGEDPLDCATRELEEETGYKAGNMVSMFAMYSAIGFCTEVLHIYLATNLTPGTVHLDPDEFVSVETYTLEEAIAMIFSGEIIDSKTISALLAYQQHSF